MFPEFVQWELKLRKRCLREKKWSAANHCLTRLRMLKELQNELSGGATFWQTYELETGRKFENSTLLQLTQFLQTHQPNVAQFNGALQQLKRFLFEKQQVTSVQEAQNLALQMLGKDPEFIRQFLAKQQQEQAALENLVETLKEAVDTQAKVADIQLAQEKQEQEEVQEPMSAAQQEALQEAQELVQQISMRPPAQIQAQAQAQVPTSVQLLFASLVALVGAFFETTDATTRIGIFAMFLVVFRILHWLRYI